MPSLLGPTNFPPLESLLNGCPVAVTPQARENLGNWHGVIELNGNDIQAWSNVLDLDSSFEKVDVQMIQTHVSEAAALNVNKLISIFNNFSAMKNTYA